MTTALISFAAVVVAALISLFTARLTQRSSPYGELSKRVVALEKSDREKGRRISRLESDQEILINDLGRQHDWREQGDPPPPPALSQKSLQLLSIHRQQREMDDRYGESAKEGSQEGNPE